MRLELERRVEGWKATRSDGKAEARNFVAENVSYTRTLSMGELLDRRRHASAGWAERRVGVRARLEAMASERDLVRRTLETQILAEQRQRQLAQLGGGSPRALAGARPATSHGSPRALGGAGGAPAHVTPGGTPLPVALRSLPPRERAAILRLEMERRRRWVSLLVLAARASHMLDELVVARNSRHLVRQQHASARMIQRQFTARAMRRSLELLQRSMGCLRKNTAIFAFRWRVRNKVRAADLITAPVTSRDLPVTSRDLA